MTHWSGSRDIWGIDSRYNYYTVALVDMVTGYLVMLLVLKEYVYIDSPIIILL